MGLMISEKANLICMGDPDRGRELYAERPRALFLLSNPYGGPGAL